MDKINFIDKKITRILGKLGEFGDEWVRGWHESSDSRGFRNFCCGSMI